MRSLRRERLDHILPRASRGGSFIARPLHDGKDRTGLLIGLVLLADLRQVDFCRLATIGHAIATGEKVAFNLPVMLPLGELLGE